MCLRLRFVANCDHVAFRVGADAGAGSIVHQIWIDLGRVCPPAARAVISVGPTETVGPYPRGKAADAGRLGPPHDGVACVR